MQHIDRRSFLKTSTLAVGGMAGAPSNGRDDRMNILYIFTDQQTASAMSCAGNPYLRTPAMDRVAERGIRFERAYCGNPLCVPSRTVMMTGRMPHETGITWNMHDEPGQLQCPMVGRLLADAGYDCGYVGKWHLPLPVSAVEQHGFGYHAIKSADLRDARYHEPAIEFLRRKRGKPFFLTVSYINPHDICQWARGEELPHGAIPELPPPQECPPLPDNFGIPAGEPSILREIKGKDMRLYPSVEWKPDRWRQYRWAYYRMTELVDGHIGKILDTVDEVGLWDNTLVIFSSDHGDGAAGHQWNQKQVLYEEPARVPFLLASPETAKKGRADNTHLVGAGQDLMPTLCDYAGAGVPEGVRGASLRPLALDDPPKTWRDALVAETEFQFRGEGSGIFGRMLRTQGHKYIVYSHGRNREQLFDLENDPGEMNDLTLDPEARPVLEDHRRRIAAWGVETGDTFPYV